MYQEEKIPLAVDDPNRAEVKPKKESISDDDFGIEKKTREFIESLKSGDGNSDDKFQELVNAMTKKAFSEINKLDEIIKTVEDESNRVEIERQKRVIKANLIKSVAKIEHLSSNYHNEDKE